MRVCKAQLKSISAYSQTRNHESPKKKGESHDEYDQRTWREKTHTDRDDQVIITQFALKNCIKDAARRLREKVPDRGKEEFGKHFGSGVLVLESLRLGIKKQDLQALRLFVPSMPSKPNGPHVWKNFPLIPEWTGEVTFYVLDDLITREVFERHLEFAGMFIGLGAMRCGNGAGIWGRFSVVKTVWSEEEF